MCSPARREQASPARRAGERRRATIAESATVVQGHGLVWGTPKTHERRQVPIPKFLVAELRGRVAGKQLDDLVFTGVRGGGPLRAPVFRAGFDAAAQAIGIADLHHELRHTAASLAIASGADVKVVQQMLGHSSAAMTMAVYGHLFYDGSTRSPTPSTPPGRRPMPLPTLRISCQIVAKCRGGGARVVQGERQNRRSGREIEKRPRQDSNLRHRLRRAVLYPLSYGGSRRRQGSSGAAGPMTLTSGG